MNWLEVFSGDENLQEDFLSFLKNYGNGGLKQAMHLYIDKQQEYLCKTKNSVSVFKISDIYYLAIQGHDIAIHTDHGVYHKYGTLSRELKRLSACGFFRCSQSCIVSLDKIKSIQGDEITLVNGGKIHMSRSYTLKIVMEFSRRKENSGF